MSAFSETSANCESININSLASDDHSFNVSGINPEISQLPSMPKFTRQYQYGLTTDDYVYDTDIDFSSLDHIVDHTFQVSYDANTDKFLVDDNDALPETFNSDPAIKPQWSI